MLTERWWRREREHASAHASRQYGKRSDPIRFPFILLKEKGVPFPEIQKMSCISALFSF